MSNEAITYMVAGICGVFAIAAYVGLILVPAWGSYQRWWERCAASFLSLYVLVAFAIVGVGGGATIVWFWDRISV
ncbi:hypothetical protein [Paraconexibacter sp.]|uniref:hypothetical protein n=1 Tax=Paraconexibacter sp. TaxID=2949640 RepID=UPI003569B523